MGAPLSSSPRNAAGVTRSIRATLKPKLRAPATSKPLEETKTTSSGRHIQPFLDQFVGAGIGLEDLIRIDADHGVQIVVQAGVTHQRVQHAGAAIGQNCATVVFQRCQRFLRLRIGGQIVVCVEKAPKQGIVGRQAQRAEGVVERFAADGQKILVAAHQGSEPAVFQLLQAPDLCDVFAVTRKRGVDNAGDGLDIVQRAVSVEDECLDGHSAAS